jgi:site-specific recombinase XerD
MYNDISEIEEYFSVLELDKSPNTLRSYEKSVTKFLDFTGFTTIEEIENCGASKVREFQKYLQQDEKMENTSINAMLAPLKAMINWMCSEENSYATKNPFVGVKALKAIKKDKAFMEEDEVKRLISSTKSFENKTIFLLYLTTGLRRTELVNLKLDGFDGQKITFIGKGNHEDTIRLLPEIAYMLHMYIEWRMKKYGTKQKEIFISKYNKKYSDGAMLYKFKTALKNAGFSEKRLDELHVHSLRHTFCANVGAQTEDAFTLQKAMRHADIATTKIYLHMKDKKVEHAIMNQKFM